MQYQFDCIYCSSHIRILLKLIMEIIFALVLLGPVTVGLSSKSSCVLAPSSFTHPPNDGLLDYACDVCKKLSEPYTDFRKQCYSSINYKQVDNITRHCPTIVHSGNKEKIFLFWRSINDICVSSGLKPFEPQLCECEPCAHLAAYNSEFMRICGPHFDQYSLSELLYACRQKEEDPGRLWLFYQDLKSECYSLTGQNITLPICGCDVCWKLLDESSEFMRTCGTYMDRREINQLMFTCEKIRCDPVELGCFKMDLEMICERKMNSTFEFPQCGCEECWLLFQTDSDFMKKCGSGMSDTMLRALLKTCYKHMNNLDYYMSFVDNLEIVCYEKRNGYFKKEWCHCHNCLLPDDPTFDIWQDCIKYMSDFEKLKMRHNCYENIEHFKKDLIDDCYAKSGNNVTLPECDCCRRDNLCIQIVADFSHMVRSNEDLVSVFDNCFNQLEIGWNKSLVGYLIFSEYIMELVNVCTSYRDHTINLSRYDRFNPRYFLGNNITSAIDWMAKYLNECNKCENKHKYGIILTPGYNPTNFIMNAIKKVPEDITLIAVGTKHSHVDNLLMIARNIPDNVYDFEYFNILSAIDDDLKRRRRC